MGRDVVARVAWPAALALVLVAAAAFSLAGVRGLLGVLAGGGIGLASVAWLAMGSGRAAALLRGRRVHPLWLLSLGFRHISLFAALAALLWSDSVHPIGLMAGLTILPPVLIIQALCAGARHP